MDNKTKTVRFAIQKPTIVNSVDPADTITKHISRKISMGYGASPRLIVAACGISILLAYFTNKMTKSKKSGCSLQDNFILSSCALELIIMRHHELLIYYKTHI